MIFRLRSFLTLFEDIRYFVCENIVNRLESKGIQKVSIVKKTGVGEIISEHYEIIINKCYKHILQLPTLCNAE